MSVNDEGHRHAPARVAGEQRVDALGVEPGAELVEHGAGLGQLAHAIAVGVTCLGVGTREQDARPRRLVAGARLLPEAKRVAKRRTAPGRVAARERDGAGGEAGRCVERRRVVTIRGRRQLLRGWRGVGDLAGGDRDLDERRQEPRARSSAGRSSVTARGGSRRARRTSCRGRAGAASGPARVAAERRRPGRKPRRPWRALRAGAAPRRSRRRRRAARRGAQPASSCVASGGRRLGVLELALDNASPRRG